MTDRQLLELAAKAAGLHDLEWCEIWGCLAKKDALGYGFDRRTRWEPHNDDGDALRLAVKLRMSVSISTAHTEVCWYDEVRSETYRIEQWDNDMTPEQWTRRAIVRAAAEIGKEMK